MADENSPQKKGKSLKFAGLILTGCLVLGGGAGIAATKVLGNAEAESTQGHGSGHGETHSESLPVAPTMKNLDIARISVSLQPENDQKKGRYFIIDAVVRYDAAGAPAGLAAAEEDEDHGSSGHGGEKTDKPSAEYGDVGLLVQDAFIEYLANLTESDISGSSGMARVRSELLRRAQVVFANNAPKELLFQEYILQ